MAKKEDKGRGKKILKYVLVIVLFIILLNLLILIAGEMTSDKEQTAINATEGDFDEPPEFGNVTPHAVVMNLPAVDAEGNGVTTLLRVEAVPGSGRTLADIENLLFWADTQQSIRMARFVANNYTDETVDDNDLIYTIKANASVIGGPSAGAALTVSTIFAMNGEQPREDVMITGTINHDGTIGPVGGILEKAEASKDAGANILLVPLLQSREVEYETKEHCQQFGPARICNTETKPREVDIGTEVGIQVIEVRNIDEALKYFQTGSTNSSGF